MSSGDKPIDDLDAATSAAPLVPLLDDGGVLDVLRQASRIAIVGASSHPWRASNSVMRYLLEQGYRCVPVTPTRDEVLGQACFDTLEEAVASTGGPFDIVDVFRRPSFTPDIARSAVATGCGTLWLQLGVVNRDAARIAHEGGVGVVMDRCTAIEHRRLRSRGR
jgi:hypothetical protein